MSNKHSLYVATIALFATAFLTGISACAGGSKSENNTDHQPRHADPEWVQLFNGETLDGWEITNFVLHGPVQVAESSILLEMGDGCTGVTREGDFPGMDYEVKLEAKKITGNDFFCGMTFPVGDSFCSLIVGGWGVLPEIRNTVKMEISVQ